MKRALAFCAFLSFFDSAAIAAANRAVALQTVDLSDKGMSTEGGEAKLLRVTSGKSSYCRIDVVHYGETGKTTYGFAFNPRLFSAAKREYRYAEPIYTNPNVKVARTEVMTLKTPTGAKTLPTAFQEYRAFFEPRKLARCSRP
jgi:hypothetical protein